MIISKRINQVINILALIGVVIVGIYVSYLINKQNEEESINKELLRAKFGNPRPFKLNSELLEPNTPGIVTASDNHEYLVINHYNIMHYIECKKCINKKDTL